MSFNVDLLLEQFITMDNAVSELESSKRTYEAALLHSTFWEPIINRITRNYKDGEKLFKGLIKGIEQSRKFAAEVLLLTQEQKCEKDKLTDIKKEVKLWQNLLRDNSPSVKKAANKHLKDLCESVECIDQPSEAQRNFYAAICNL